jgi:hypothetical protein
MAGEEIMSQRVLPKNWISLTVNLKEVAREVPADVYVAVKDEMEIIEALLHLHGKAQVTEWLNEHFKEFN